MNTTKARFSAIVAAITLAACGPSREVVYQPACPELPVYSPENQKATAAELRQARARGEYPHLREKATDIVNVRSQLAGAGCKPHGAPRPQLTPAPATPAPGGPTGGLTPR